MTTTTANIFEQASRIKLRFDTGIGKLTVEDLWELPLSHANESKLTLDSIAVGLHKKLEGTGESFVKSAKKDAVLQLSFDIVINMIETRQKEIEAKTAAKRVETEISKISEALAKKKDAALEGMSVEALEARLLALKAAP